MATQAFLDQHCNEFFGDFTGVLRRLGAARRCRRRPGAGPSSDKGLATSLPLRERRATRGLSGPARAAAASSSRITPIAAAPAAVTFTRLDTRRSAATIPQRDLRVDPTDPYHAYVSFSGYNAYTPTTPGHVFDVMLQPGDRRPTWTDLSFDLGDQPITAIALDAGNGDLFAPPTSVSSRAEAGRATGLPPIRSGCRPSRSTALRSTRELPVLYAATHGRGIWRLDLSRSQDN